jgi:medium-chain acyl-[acyl-carrier-protein] hydrolase
MRLFCFPYAGGGPAIFSAWGNLLPSLEVVAVQYPGRGSRMLEEPFTDMNALVKAAAEGILPYLHTKPFAFFGHSMGSTVAFEVAQYLKRTHGIEPAHLFVSGRISPHTPYNRKKIHDLPDRELIAELKTLGGTPPEVLADDDLMQLVLPLIRADFATAENYVATTDQPLNCPLTAFSGTHDDRANETEMGEWGRYTRSNFEVLVFQGDHFFLHGDQAQKEVVAAIQNGLTRNSQANKR